MKQDPKRHGAAKRVLQITPAIRTAAKEVVRAYDAFDWDELRNADLDVVFLTFETHADLARADDLVHQLASTDPTFIVGILRKHLRHFFPPVRQYAEGCIELLQGLLCEEASDRGAALKSKIRTSETLHKQVERLERLFKNSIDALVDHQQSCDALERFSIWKEAVSTLNKLEVVRQALLANLKNSCGATRTSPPPPIRPLRVGSRGDGWLSLPLSLFAQRIAVFSRKIAGLNTGVRNVIVDEGIVTFHELFAQCGLLRVELPWQDDLPLSKGNELQKTTDRLSDAMHALLIEIVSQTDIKQPSEKVQNGSLRTSAESGDVLAAGAASALQLGPKLMDNKPGVSVAPVREIPGSAARAVNLGHEQQALKDTESTKSGEEKAHAVHEVTIDERFSVTVDGRHEKREQIRRTLLGLAIYAKDRTGEVFHVNSREYLKQVEGPERDWSKRWNARCKALECSMLLRDGDVPNLDVFVADLKRNADAVSKRLQANFPSQLREQIAAYKKGSHPQAEKTLKKALLRSPNLTIKGRPIAEGIPPAGLKGSMEGSEVALDVAMQQEYSNRMLLQRTYPKVIRDQPIFPWFSATRVSDGEYDISGFRRKT